ncbi:ABC transporter ATP-binding protein [Desulforhopalus sp. 52FAK]
MMMLSVENLSVAYTRDKHVIPAAMDINFSAAAGECLGIIGESGCGKTSLALGIMGLIRGGSVSGKVRFRGQDLTAMNEGQRRSYRWRNIAMVFQNSLEILNPVTTLGEQLAEPLTTHLGLSIKEAAEKVSAMLTMTGLDPDWQKAYPHQLSGGMRQRALIAMALCCAPDVLIVDEPTTSLDPDSRNAVLNLLQELQQQLGFTMILISHNLSAIHQLTSRLLTMYSGRIIEEGATQDILCNPLHPYSRGLINSAPDFFPYKDLWGINGTPPKPGETRGCSFSPRCCQSAQLCKSCNPPLQDLENARRVACHKGGIETILTATAIQKNYSLGEKTIKALRGVDLMVRRGEVVALVGKSGSGKSTLAHILGGVLQADGGKIRFRGNPVQKCETTATTGGIQLVFQDPGEAVSHRLSVLDAVREPLDILAWGDPAARHEKAVQSLAAMHLPTSQDFLSRPCHSLSGGQRQRVAIARSLTTEPLLLVADEITAMLDPSTQAVILRELKGRQHQNGFAMLFITHNIHLARKIADRVYVMDHGVIVDKGAAFEVLDNTPLHVPNELLQSLKN